MQEAEETHAVTRIDGKIASGVAVFHFCCVGMMNANFILSHCMHIVLVYVGLALHYMFEF